MVEKISAEQAYMNHVMKQLPQAERGNVYKIKVNDSLWNIAKHNVASKNPKASKAEIQNYMYQIAKLNNITTIEQMNRLKVSTEIYLPKEVTSTRKNKTVTTPAPVKTPQRTSAETSVAKLINQIKNDKTVFIEKMYKGYEAPTDFYHVYCRYHDPKTGYRTPKHLLMSFSQNKNGEIIEILFDDQQADKYQIKSDYIMDQKGNIVTNNIFHQTNEGKATPAEIKELHSLLTSRISDKTPYNF